MAKLKIHVGNRILEFDKNTRVINKPEGAIQLINPSGEVIAEFPKGTYGYWYLG